MAFCRNCGNTIGSDWKVCTNCGAPIETVPRTTLATRWAALGTGARAALIGGALVVIFGALGAAGLGSNPASTKLPTRPPTTPKPITTARSTAAPSAAPTATSTSDLDAGLRRTPGGVELTNKSNFNWQTCKISINPGVIRSGWDREIDGLTAGGTVELFYGSFTKPDGTRFNLATTAVNEVTVSCDTARGHQFAAFK